MVPSTSPLLVSIPAQEIHLELMVLEVGKDLDMQIYELSDSPVIQEKVSKAMEALSLELSSLEVFPAAGPTGVIKKPFQEMHIFNRASNGPSEK